MTIDSAGASAIQLSFFTVTSSSSCYNRRRNSNAPGGLHSGIDGILFGVC